MTTRRQARTYRPTPRNLAFLARQLQRGELVAVPTETVYGLAANALDAAACRRIFAAKGRPSTDPLIVHLHSLDQLEQICEPNAVALRLARKFWPGGLTMVLPKKAIVPAIVTAGRDSVAVRMPSHPVFRRLIARARLPLAAPSANPFGYISPTTAEHVRDGLGDRIRYILDGGAALIGVESTIIDLRDPQTPRILRAGAVTREKLERALRRPLIAGQPRTAVSPRSGQLAPGLMARHYSPRTTLLLHRRLAVSGAAMDADEAFVYLRKPARTVGKNIFWLDPRGNLEGAARRLFALLRKLDRMHFRRIHIERAPDRGIGHAINDRLRRAAART